MIELGVKEWTAAAMPDAPTWAKDPVQLSWGTTAHVKVTFANELPRSQHRSRQNLQDNSPSRRHHRVDRRRTAQDSAASSDRLDLDSDVAVAKAPLASTTREVDVDVTMQDLDLGTPAPNATASQLPGAIMAEDSSDVAKAMSSVVNRPRRPSRPCPPTDPSRYVWRRVLPSGAALPAGERARAGSTRAVGHRPICTGQRKEPV